MPGRCDGGRSGKGVLNREMPLSDARGGGEAAAADGSDGKEKKVEAGSGFAYGALWRLSTPMQESMGGRLYGTHPLAGAPSGGPASFGAPGDYPAGATAGSEPVSLQYHPPQTRRRLCGKS